MKKLLAVSAIAVFSSVAANAGGLPEEMPATPAASIASDTGVYVGISGGYGLNNWKNINQATFAVQGIPTPTTVNKDNGVVSRVFLGYDITRYVAIELGYTYFFNKPTFSNAAGTETGKMKFTHNIDLMGKIKAPIVDNFDLYGKIGANYLMTKGENGVTSPKNVNVAYGAGADYYITSNVVANIEWLRFNGHAKLTNADYQPHSDAFLVGLRYKFDL
jgi:opacity protein-like surface antigen